MGYRLNKKAAELKAYETEGNRYPVQLDANESFCLLPEAVRKEILEALEKAVYNRYPDSRSRTCIEAFAAYYGIHPRCLTAGNGSDELIGVILNGFFSRGERLLLAEPDFSMYRFYAHGAELEVEAYEKGGDFEIKPEAFEEKLRSGAFRGVIFSNPCSPTSLGLDRETIKGLIRTFPAVLFILDEAYMDFWDQSLLPEVEAYDNLIILRTCSKALGAAGIRLGFAAANPVLTGALQALRSPYNVNGLTQAAAAVILGHPQALKKALEEILSEKAILTEGLERIAAAFAGKALSFRVLPKSRTNFLALVFVTADAQAETAAYLKARGILVRSLPGVMRVTVGSREENERLLEALGTMPR